MSASVFSASAQLLIFIALELVIGIIWFTSSVALASVLALGVFFLLPHGCRYRVNPYR